MANYSSGNVLLDEKIREWLNWDKNEKTHAEIKQLADSQNYSTLENLLLKRLEFGTAGLRAALGAGYSKMNDLTVIQTTQGLCKYLLAQFDDCRNKGVVIGHDARYGSHRFARLASAVFLSAGVKVYLFSDIVPTPFVPFAVNRYGCVGGIMVTASHNPKEDNGYKVYYSNAAQIIPPHDVGISDCIMSSLEPYESSWNEDIHKGHENCVDPLADILESYMKTIQKHCHHRELNTTSSLKITYTAMHGVGEKYEVEAFKAFSLNPFVSTKEQAEPDPEFPTVKYPNPEEGKGALTLAIATAERNGSPVIIANDPDADRLAVAEKTANGTWKIFTGNEIGFLLGWWAFVKDKEINGELYTGDNVFMVHSTVSSNILQSIAKVEGFQVVETLTGFKWIGNKVIDLRNEGKHPIFGFEEAIGFMFGDQVVDKDGISAGAVMSEMASFLYDQNKTLHGMLQELYQKYGLNISNNSYFLCYSAETIKKIFDRIRSVEDGKYPTHLGPFKITGIRDLYGDGYDNTQPNNKPILPTSSGSQMITFTFEKGCVATIRTSGTEPKIKYYTEISGSKNPGLTDDALKETLDLLVSHLINELLQPKLNNLEERKES